MLGSYAICRFNFPKFFASMKNFLGFNFIPSQSSVTMSTLSTLVRCLIFISNYSAVTFGSFMALVSICSLYWLGLTLTITCLVVRSLFNCLRGHRDSFIYSANWAADIYLSTLWIIFTFGLAIASVSIIAQIGEWSDPERWFCLSALSLDQLCPDLTYFALVLIDSVLKLFAYLLLHVSRVAPLAWVFEA